MFCKILKKNKMRIKKRKDKWKRRALSQSTNGPVPGSLGRSPLRDARAMPRPHQEIYRSRLWCEVCIVFHWTGSVHFSKLQWIFIFCFLCFCYHFSWSYLVFLLLVLSFLLFIFQINFPGLIFFNEFETFSNRRWSFLWMVWNFFILHISLTLYLTCF